MTSIIKSIILTLALSCAIALGYAMGIRHNAAPTQQTQHALDVSGTSPARDEAPKPENADAKSGSRKILYYRNPMGQPDTSPVPKQDEMGMDYVPVYADDFAKEPGTVRVSAELVQRLGVRSEPVKRIALSRGARAVGTVQIDESRQTVVSPRFDGWIEKLFVGTTGQFVKKGEALLTIYSPQIVEIESEYISTSAVSSSATAGRGGSLTRLRNLGIPEEELDRLQRERKVNPHIIVRASTDGTVLEKQAVDGLKFVAGDRLFRIVDLSNVWIIAEIFEQDLSKISLGQSAKITFAAYPDKVFEGKVSFVYPDINSATRTAKIRVELPNADSLLRIDMYGNVEIESSQAEAALVVPLSALLNNGKTKAVLLDRGDGAFQPRTVKTGLSNDGYSEILEGLSEGDRVVTSAAFLIDSESNIRAALETFEQEEIKQ